MLDSDKQREHYDRMMADRRPTKGLSCGYDSRFDPFLLDRRPDLIPEFTNILERALPERPRRLLDLGCGSGLYFPVLAPMADEIVGIDISSGMIQAAQALLDEKKIDNITLKVGSADTLPFEDGSFDAVLGFDVLHHLPDVPATLREVHRVLEPDGLFSSIEPNVLNPIVFVAHALPEEERGALRHNWPWAIRNLLRRQFTSLKSDYVNHVTAPNSGVILAGVKVVNLLTKIWPLSYFSIRMLWTCRKSSAAPEKG